MLPVGADANAMAILLPRQHVRHLRPRALDDGRPRAAEREACFGDRGAGRAQAKAAGAIAGAGRDVRRVHGKPPDSKLVECLAGVVREPRPARRKRCRTTAEGAVAIECLAHEHRVTAAERRVGANRHQTVHRWTREDTAEPGELRRRRLHRRDAALVVPLEAGEVEHAMGPERSSRGPAELVPLKERIGVDGASPESGVGGEMVIAEERERPRVRHTATRAGNDVDGAVRGKTGRRVEVRRRDLEFLHDLLRELQKCADGSKRVDARPVDGDPRVAHARNRLQT